jgi:hypothetical protein
MGENIKTGIDAPYKNRYSRNAPGALSSRQISSKDIKPKNIYCLLDEDDETTDDETASTTSTASMSTITSTPTPSTKYDFSCFKNQKYYYSWADADSSDDEK